MGSDSARSPGATRPGSPLEVQAAGVPSLPDLGSVHEMTDAAQTEAGWLSRLAASGDAPMCL
eukprot:6124474-Alexandrium_andersonii.AAC.1